MNEAVIDILQGRVRDLGDGEMVRRVLPIGHRLMVGPFIFFDHMGPWNMAPGRGVDVRPHPHIGLATVTYLFEGRIDHREDKNASLDVQYGPAHDVQVRDGGLLAKLLAEKAFKVNSLHSQGIDRLAPPLFAEATAPDGTIEAVSMPAARGFLLGTQWHPEWKWSDNPVSRALFAAFGEAVRKNARV